MVLKAKETMVASEIPLTRVAVLKTSAGMIQDIVPEALVVISLRNIYVLDGICVPETEVEEPGTCNDKCPVSGIV